MASNERKTLASAVEEYERKKKEGIGRREYSSQSKRRPHHKGDPLSRVQRPSPEQEEVQKAVQEEIDKAELERLREEVLRLKKEKEEEEAKSKDKKGDNKGGSWFPNFGSGSTPPPQPKASQAPAPTTAPAFAKSPAPPVGGVGPVAKIDDHTTGSNTSGVKLDHSAGQNSGATTNQISNQNGHSGGRDSSDNKGNSNPSNEPQSGDHGGFLKPKEQPPHQSTNQTPGTQNQQGLLNSLKNLDPVAIGTLGVGTTAGLYGLFQAYKAYKERGALREARNDAERQAGGLADAGRPDEGGGGGGFDPGPGGGGGGAPGGPGPGPGGGGGGLGNADRDAVADAAQRRADAAEAEDLRKTARKNLADEGLKNIFDERKIPLQGVKESLPYKDAPLKSSKYSGIRSEISSSDDGKDRDLLPPPDPEENLEPLQEPVANVQPLKKIKKHRARSADGDEKERPFGRLKESVERAREVRDDLGQPKIDREEQDPFDVAEAMYRPQQRDRSERREGYALPPDGSDNSSEEKFSLDSKAQSDGGNVANRGGQTEVLMEKLKQLGPNEAFSSNLGGREPPPPSRKEAEPEKEPRREIDPLEAIQAEFFSREALAAAAGNLVAPPPRNDRPAIDDGSIPAPINEIDPIRREAFEAPAAQPQVQPVQQEQPPQAQPVQQEQPPQAQPVQQEQPPQAQPVQQEQPPQAQQEQQQQGPALAPLQPEPVLDLVPIVRREDFESRIAEISKQLEVGNDQLVVAFTAPPEISLSDRLQGIRNAIQENLAVGSRLLSAQENARFENVHQTLMLYRASQADVTEIQMVKELREIREKLEEILDELARAFSEYMQPLALRAQGEIRSIRLLPLPMSINQTFISLSTLIGFITRSPIVSNARASNFLTIISDSYIGLEQLAGRMSSILPNSSDVRGGISLIVRSFLSLMSHPDRISSNIPMLSIIAWARAGRIPVEAAAPETVQRIINLVHDNPDVAAIINMSIPAHVLTESGRAFQELLMQHQTLTPAVKRFMADLIFLNTAAAENSGVNVGNLSIEDARDIERGLKEYLEKILFRQAGDALAGSVIGFSQASSQASSYLAPLANLADRIPLFGGLISDMLSGSNGGQNFSQEDRRQLNQLMWSPAGIVGWKLSAGVFIGTAALSGALLTGTAVAAGVYALGNYLTGRRAANAPAMISGDEEARVFNRVALPEIQTRLRGSSLLSYQFHEEILRSGRSNTMFFLTATIDRLRAHRQSLGRTSFLEMLAIDNAIHGMELDSFLFNFTSYYSDVPYQSLLSLDRSTYGEFLLYAPFYAGRFYQGATVGDRIENIITNSVYRSNQWIQGLAKNKEMLDLIRGIDEAPVILSRPIIELMRNTFVYVGSPPPSNAHEALELYSSGYANQWRGLNDRSFPVRAVLNASYRASSMSSYLELMFAWHLSTTASVDDLVFEEDGAAGERQQIHGFTEALGGRDAYVRAVRQFYLGFSSAPGLAMASAHAASLERERRTELMNSAIFIAGAIANSTSPPGFSQFLFGQTVGNLSALTGSHDRITVGAFGYPASSFRLLPDNSVRALTAATMFAMMVREAGAMVSSAPQINIVPGNSGRLAIVRRVPGRLWGSTEHRLSLSGTPINDDSFNAMIVRSRGSRQASQTRFREIAVRLAESRLPSGAPAFRHFSSYAMGGFQSIRCIRSIAASAAYAHFRHYLYYLRIEGMIGVRTNPVYLRLADQPEAQLQNRLASAFGDSLPRDLPARDRMLIAPPDTFDFFMVDGSFLLDRRLFSGSLIEGLLSREHNPGRRRSGELTYFFNHFLIEQVPRSASAAEVANDLRRQVGEFLTKESAQMPVKPKEKYLILPDIKRVDPKEQKKYDIDLENYYFHRNLAIGYGRIINQLFDLSIQAGEDFFSKNPQLIYTTPDAPLYDLLFSSVMRPMIAFLVEEDIDDIFNFDIQNTSEEHIEDCERFRRSIRALKDISNLFELSCNTHEDAVNQMSIAISALSLRFLKADDISGLALQKEVLAKNLDRGESSKYSPYLIYLLMEICGIVLDHFNFDTDEEYYQAPVTLQLTLPRFRPRPDPEFVPFPAAGSADPFEDLERRYTLEAFKEHIGGVQELPVNRDQRFFTGEAFVSLRHLLFTGGTEEAIQNAFLRAHSSLCRDISSASGDVFDNVMFANFSNDREVQGLRFDDILNSVSNVNDILEENEEILRSAVTYADEAARVINQPQIEDSFYTRGLRLFGASRPVVAEGTLDEFRKDVDSSLIAPLEGVFGQVWDREIVDRATIGRLGELLAAARESQNTALQLAREGHVTRFRGELDNLNVLVIAAQEAIGETVAQLNMKVGAIRRLSESTRNAMLQSRGLVAYRLMQSFTQNLLNEPVSPRHGRTFLEVVTVGDGLARDEQMSIRRAVSQEEIIRLRGSLVTLIECVQAAYATATSSYMDFVDMSGAGRDIGNMLSVFRAKPAARAAIVAYLQQYKAMYMQVSAELEKISSVFQHLKKVDKE